MDASNGDDEDERGRDPLDHLPDVEETVLPGGGGATSGSAIAYLGAEADTPEKRPLGKRAVSPVGSTAAVVQVAAVTPRVLALHNLTCIT